MNMKPKYRGIIDQKANTTIEFTIIRQRFFFSFECVLNIFSCVCVCLIVYIVPNTVLLFHGVAIFFLFLFFLA